VLYPALFEPAGGLIEFTVQPTLHIFKQLPLVALECQHIIGLALE